MIWALIPRLDETADHMFFVVATARTYIVPKRDLPPGLILAIRDFARANGKLKGYAPAKPSPTGPWR